MNNKIIKPDSVEGKYVVLGDMENSRKSNDKGGLRLKVISSLKYINSKFKQDIYIPFEIYKGIDEIGGVVNSPQNLYNIFEYLNNEIYPARVRIVAINALFDLYDKSNKTSHLDGVAFHLAAAAMAGLKKRKKYFEIDSGDYNRKYSDDLAINQIIDLIQVIKNRMTRRQWEIGLLIRKNINTINQVSIAKKLNISQQAVSDALNSSNYYEVLNAEISVNTLLGKLKKG